MQNMPMRLAAPPRRIPLSIQILNVFNGGAQFGWIFFGFGLMFFWIFGQNADLSFVTFRPDGRATGRVTKVVDTNASENDRRVVAAHYEYSVAGEWFEGTSYSTAGGHAEGLDVTIEFDRDNPARSRIAGMRRAMFGPWAMIVAIFPLVGFAIVYFATRSGIERNHLLREGVLTTGKLVDKEPTNVTVNKRRVWALKFAFTDRQGQRHEATARTTDTAPLEDEAAEPLLYDPNDPKRAYVLDELPARPRFDPDGEMEGRPLAALLALILPVGVTAANVVAAMYLLR